MSIRLNFYLKARNKNLDESIVLTFDDGPHPEYTLKILDVLDQYQVKAVFFMIGKNVIAYPEIAKEVVLRGHQVGIHSHNHAISFGFSFGSRLLKEINNCSKAIEDATGLRTNLFRPPFGVTNPKIARIVRLNKLITIGWNLRSFDTRYKNADGLVSHIAGQVKAGSIVLLHDRLANTCEALPKIIEKINGMGFAFGSLKINENEL